MRFAIYGTPPHGATLRLRLVRGYQAHRHGATLRLRLVWGYQALAPTGQLKV